MHFRRGDYVMVAAEGNQANIQRHSKAMVKYQGPYECMGLADGDPDKVLVRLVGQDDVAKVSWRRVFRIAGPDMPITQAVQDSALHDLQRLKVESFQDWGFADDGSVVFKVRWRGFSADEDTWEPMVQLDEDVEVLVDKCVEDIDNVDLTQALLQMRGRRRSRTATARRQTDRLAGRTYADAAARRSRRAQARQTLASDAASATNDTADAINTTLADKNAARDDRARRHTSRHR